MCAIGTASLSAGEFINLDFNSPDLSGTLVPLLPGGPFLGTASQLVPGWKVTVDGAQVSDLAYSLLGQTIGPTAVTLQQGEIGGESTAGYFLWLISRNSNDGKPGPDIWLSQTGVVPMGATGLRVIGGSLVEGYIDGKLIGRTDPNKGLGALWDVTAYQGKEVSLQLHSPSNWDNRFDIVGFTTVPEPSTVGMLALGLGLIGSQAWKRR